MAGPVVTPTWPGYCGICRFITPGAWAATARGGQLEPELGGLPGVGVAPRAAVVVRGKVLPRVGHRLPDGGHRHVAVVALVAGAEAGQRGLGLQLEARYRGLHLCAPRSKPAQRAPWPWWRRCPS